LQLSAVQGFESSQLGGVPAEQTPAPSQVSRPLQALPSLHEVPVATNSCAQPDCGSHASIVQGLASSQDTGAPATHCPAAQASPDVQESPSLHAVPSTTAAWTQPTSGLQLSAVQGFESSQLGGVPAEQTPAPSQVSRPLQALPSLHEIPAATAAWTQPTSGLQLSIVQGLESLQSGAAPG
jgi:hypothetical protein